MFCSNKTHLDESYLDIFWLEQGTNRKNRVWKVLEKKACWFFFPFDSMKFCDERDKMMRIVN